MSNEVWAGHRAGELRVDVLSLGGVVLGTLDGVDDASPGRLDFSVHQAIRGQGSLRCTGSRDDWLTIRLRPVFVMTAPVVGEFPLGVFIPATPRSVTDGTAGLRYDVELYDRLHVLAGAKCTRTYVVEVGTAIVPLVRSLIAEHGEGLASIADSPAVVRVAMSWDTGTSWLRIVNDLLGAAGFVALSYDGEGVARSAPYVPPAARPVEWVFEDGPASIRGEELAVDADYFDVFNQVVAVASSSGEEPELRAVAENFDRGPLSRQQLGRWVTRHEPAVDAANLAALQAYADRLLAEADEMTVGATIEHGWLPFLGLNDRARAVDSLTGVDVTGSVSEFSVPLDPTELVTTKIGDVRSPEDWIEGLRTTEPPLISWAEVTSVGPLEIRRDGETVPLAASPGLIANVRVGERVAVTRNGRQLIVLGSAAGAGGVPPGMTGHYAGEIIPPGWLLCDGSAVSRATYPDLFAAIGTTFGVGNGTTTFNLPPAGRTLVAQAPGDPDFGALGKLGGAKTHTLTVGEMPAHTHEQNPHSHALGDGSAHSFAWGVNKGTVSVPNANAVGGTTASGNPLHTVQNDWNATRQTTATNKNTGGGAAHNNMPPYVVMPLIIKT